MERYFQWLIFPVLVGIVAFKVSLERNLESNVAEESWQGAFLKRQVSANCLKRALPKQEVVLLNKELSWQQFLEEFSGLGSLRKEEKKKLRNLPALSLGTKVITEKSRGEVRKYTVSQSNGLTVEFDKVGGDWSVNTSVPQIVRRERIVSGVVLESLEKALAENSLTARTLSDVKLALQHQASWLRRGDSFVIVVAEELQNKEIVNQSLKAIYIASTKGEIFKARLAANGKFYGLQDLTQSGGSWLASPVKYQRVSSHFSFNRFHPILGYHRPHPAVDLSAPYGSPVRSVAEGKVTHAGWLGTNGKTVIIRHKGNIETIYRHLSRVDVKLGQKVAAGTVIGAVGSTGLSTGPHLCFSVKVNGKYVNPLKFRPDWIGISLDSKVRVELQKLLTKLRDFNTRFILAQSRISRGG